MKKFIAGVLCCFLFCNSFPQKRERRNAGTSDYSVGFEAGIPEGNFRYYYSYYIGGKVQIYKPFSNNWGLTGNIGFEKFKGKTFFFDNRKIIFDSGTFLPILAGIKYQFSPSLFTLDEVGPGIGMNSNLGTHFMYSLSFGYNFNQNIDIELHQRSIVGSGSSLNHLGIKMDYNF